MQFNRLLDNSIASFCVCTFVTGLVDSLGTMVPKGEEFLVALSELALIHTEIKENRPN